MFDKNIFWKSMNHSLAKKQNKTEVRNSLRTATNVKKQQTSIKKPQSSKVIKQSPMQARNQKLDTIEKKFKISSVKIGS